MHLHLLFWMSPTQLRSRKEVPAKQVQRAQPPVQLLLQDVRYLERGSRRTTVTKSLTTVPCTVRTVGLRAM